MSQRRQLFLMVMFANVGLAVTGLIKEDWTQVWVCGLSAAFMSVGIILYALGSAAKRGDRVEPDREAGK